VTTSVVVLSYQPGDWLAECLASVRDQADEVVVVDNGSPGAAVSGIARAAGAKVIRSSVNVGFAGGINRGARAASGDLIAWLNDDAVAAPGWLAHAEAVLADSAVAAVTPKVVRRGWYREVVLADERHPSPGDARVLGRQVRSVRVDGRDVLADVVGAGVHQLESEPGRPDQRWRWSAPGQPFYVPIPGVDHADDVEINGTAAPGGAVCRVLNKAGSYLRADGILGDYGDETPDDGRFDVAAERFFASGTALVMSGDTWRRVGELPEAFFAYCEDADWSWRARLAGLRLVYDPAAVVEHRVSATSQGSVSPRFRRMAVRNRVLCQVRNAPLGVASGAVRRLVAAGPADGARRDLLRRLPWALRSRRMLAGAWELSPAAVWNRWADADVTWDTSPSRVDARS
jgi:GT2 family glycosyltransferase